MARLANVSLTLLRERSPSHAFQCSCAGSGGLKCGNPVALHLASMTQELMVDISFIVATSMWTAASLSLVLPEIATQMHQRLGQQTPVRQQRRDQPAADAAVAIGKADGWFRPACAPA
jgi:hypothetical protein